MRNYWLVLKFSFCYITITIYFAQSVSQKDNEQTHRHIMGADTSRGTGASWGRQQTSWGQVCVCVGGGGGGGGQTHHGDRCIIGQATDIMGTGTLCVCVCVGGGGTQVHHGAGNRHHGDRHIVCVCVGGGGGGGGGEQAHHGNRCIMGQETDITGTGTLCVCVWGGGGGGYFVGTGNRGTGTSWEQTH